MITIVKRLLTKSNCFNSGRRITPSGMQLHTIGTAQNSATSLASYWDQPGIDACVHYCVDAEHEGRVLQFLPENYRSWADQGVGNASAITVELMESDYMRYTGGASYTVTNETKFKADVTRAYKTAVEFFARKCLEHGWDPQAKRPDGLHYVFSHDEGRRAGLSSAHVDPTHIWGRYGWTMDGFRADVKKMMEELRSGKQTIADQKKPTTPATPASGIPASKEEFISAVGAICADLWPDLQILPSVVIAQCCLETGYGLGSDAQELVRRNNLLGMKAELINSTWSTFSVWSGESFVKRTPEVYNGRTIYINDAFRVYKDYRNCIEDYMQFLRNVRNNSGYKYRQVVGMTDPERVITAISRGGYATDPGYITKVMAIIRKENLTRFDPAQGGEAAVATEKKYYRVGTGWKAGKCTGQIGAYEKLVNAKNACAIAGYGKYRVYNPDGSVAWPAAGTTTAQKAVRWALAIAADNSHGYNNAKGQRLGNPDYACSSFIAGAWRAAGVDVAADAYTAKMKTDFTKHGFKDISDQVNLRTGAGMKCGDVVLRPGVHVEMITGAKHKLVGARGNATGGAENGAAGDQTGGEIAVIPWWDDGWTICLRYVEPKKAAAAPAAKTTYVVQAGAYKANANAEKMLVRVKSIAPDAYIVRDGDLYRIQAGAYTVKANATKRAEELKAAGISAIVKTK